MTTIIYAGSFDPPTKGHEWMFRAMNQLADTPIVAIGTNPSKKSFFSVQERIKLICGLTPAHYKVLAFEGFLVDFAKEQNANMLLRGIRSSSDFEYEYAQRVINDELAGDQLLLTVFLSPPPHLSVISSSLVKSLIGYPGWINKVMNYVDPYVLKALAEKVEDL